MAQRPHFPTVEEALHSLDSHSAPTAKKLRADQIPVSDEQIEKFLGGRLIHVKPDEPVLSDSNGSLNLQVSVLLNESNGAEHLRQVVSDLATREKTPIPDIVITKKDSINWGSIKIGNRQVIYVSESALAFTDTLPSGKWSKWDYIEGIVGHELGHLKKQSDMQLFDQLHPYNQKYIDNKVEYSIKAKALALEMTETDINKIAEEKSQGLRATREFFKSELAILNPRKLHVETPEQEIVHELTADKESVKVTGKPEAFDICLTEMEKSAIPTPEIYEALAKAGLLNHPIPETRSANLQYMAQHMHQAVPSEPVKPLETPSMGLLGFSPLSMSRH